MVMYSVKLIVESIAIWKQSKFDKRKKIINIITKASIYIFYVYLNLGANNMTKINLRDLNQKQMANFMKELGVERYRVQQLRQWVMQKGVWDFDEMTNIPKNLRQTLKDATTLGGLEILNKQISSDHTTIKYLFALPDKATIESVLMRHTYGRTACISTQVGCRMSCDFCASTIDGLVRNLSAGEMYDQVLAIQKDIGERVSHVVLMGSGEPLENYENTVRFIRNITAEDGLNISCRQITLSTCGLVPEIKKLAAERMPLTLAVSLHAADDQIRDRLMPINRRYPLAKLIPACKDYATATGRRVTFEYALIKDVNDQLEQATKLAQMLKRMLAHVNLIPVNPVKERGLERSAKEQVIKFQKELQNCGINVTIRKEMGTDIDAACGQLRRKHVCEAH